MHVVGEAVQQFSGEPFRPEDLEDQFRTGGGQRHEAQLVDDEQTEASQLSLQVEQSAVVSGLYELVDQCRSGGEAHGHSSLAGS